MPDESPTSLLAYQVRHVAIVVVVTLALGVIGLAVMANLGAARSASVAYVVGLVGTVGGTANNYRKLQALSGVPVEQLQDVPRSLVTSRIYLSPLIGAVLALTLYLLFIGGVLSGGLFPDFACSGDVFTSYRAFADCNPTTNADVALAMVWAFIAGFAENFVPNILDKLAADAAAEHPSDSSVEGVESEDEVAQPWGKTRAKATEDDEDEGRAGAATP